MTVTIDYRHSDKRWDVIGGYVDKQRASVAVEPGNAANMPWALRGKINQLDRMINDFTNQKALLQCRLSELGEPLGNE